LQIPAAPVSKPDDPPLTARLIKKSESQISPQPAANPPETNPAASVSEREQQIAAAREAHPVQLYPTIKPRMSYILSGGSKSDSAAETAPPEPKNEPESSTSPDPSAE
jgi:hypothetical protein